jgi:hypothetical protein
MFNSALMFSLCILSDLVHPFIFRRNRISAVWILFISFCEWTHVSLPYITIGEAIVIYHFILVDSVLTQVDRWRHSVSDVVEYVTTEKVTRIFFQHTSCIHTPVGNSNTLGLCWLITSYFEGWRPPTLGECHHSTLKLGHDRFLTNPSNSLFIYHHFNLHFIFWVTEKASLNKLQTNKSTTKTSGDVLILILSVIRSLLSYL